MSKKAEKVKVKVRPGQSSVIKSQYITKCLSCRAAESTCQSQRRWYHRLLH